MTMQEFKAWFEGYTECLGEKLPSVKQWKRIKERVAEIDDVAITERVFIDRYWPKWPSYPQWTYSNATISAAASQSASQSASYNGVTAMHSLGQLEAKQ